MKTLRLINDIFFPERCVFCGQNSVFPGKILCNECEDSIEFIPTPRCPKCGREAKKCRCKNLRTFYKELRAPYYNETSVRRGVDRWKFYGGIESTEVFVRDMLNIYEDEINSGLFDFVTFVPASQSTLENRGFNQSELLAEVFCAYSSLECRDCLVKTFDTPAQHTLPRYLRLGNVLGVFEVKDKESVYGKTILLIDDIKTTGTVLNECAKMLMIAGAQDVYCLTVTLG